MSTYLNGLKGTRVCLVGIRVAGLMETPPLARDKIMKAFMYESKLIPKYENYRHKKYESTIREQSHKLKSINLLKAMVTELRQTWNLVKVTLNKLLVKVTQIIGQSWSELVVIGQKKYLVNVTQVTNIQMVRS